MKLAFAVRHLGASQFNHDLIINVNRLVEARNDLDVTLLFENIARPCLHMNFASMHISEGFGYDGPVIATDLSTADKVLRFPAAAKRLFYSYDLGWFRIRQKAFRDMHRIYANDSLTLVARCKDHATVMEKAWNRDVLVVEDADIARFLEIIGERSS